MEVDVKVSLAVPTIEVRLWSNVVVVIDPMPGLRAANVCLDPKVPAAVRGLAIVVERFNALMGEASDSPTMKVYAGEHSKIVIEGWWRDVIKAAIDDGTLR